eukprot:1389650-Rhodomonas_salina.4
MSSPMLALRGGVDLSGCYAMSVTDIAHVSTRPVPCPNPTEFGCPPCDGPPTYECIKDLQCDNEEWQQKINEGYLALHDCANVFTEWPQSKIFIRMVRFSHHVFGLRVLGSRLPDVRCGLFCESGGVCEAR